MEFITHFDVKLSWRTQYCGIFKAVHEGVTYYFIDNEYYFKREGIYGFYDDAERFAFFSKAILEMLYHIDFKPQIIHANDWQTALVPVYLNLMFKSDVAFRNIKTVFTIHNIQYQGKYGMDIAGDILGIPYYAMNVIEYDGCTNFMKGAIDQADMITTVSPTYAKEILDSWFSYGLNNLLWYKQDKLCGILNGIDVDNYNPKTDPNIFKNYDKDSIADKYVNKRALMDYMELPYDEDVPVIGIVTRLVSHKGLDLVKYIFEEILEKGFQVVILGAGEYIFEDFFKLMQYKYPEQVGLRLGFVPDLARKIYSGADMFLMPSKSEPCGLAQMVSLRYGTIPIVRETGGLKDSITDVSLEGGNGYTFATYNAHDMFSAILRAKEDFDDKEKWRGIVENAFTCDFSWSKSAVEYQKMYQKVLEG